MPILFHRHFSLGTALYLLFVGAFLCLIGAYALFQARHLIDGPLITLSHEPARLTHAPTITLSGTAENITALALDGRTIYTDDQGNFSELVVLPLGYTVVTLTATDRYGRVSAVERTYVRS